jgi:hypothetical protein
LWHKNADYSSSPNPIWIDLSGIDQPAGERLQAVIAWTGNPNTSSTGCFPFQLGAARVNQSTQLNHTTHYQLNNASHRQPNPNTVISPTTNRNS